MRKATAIFLSLAAVLSCSQPKTATKTDFKFRPDGTFKIVQITDTHFGSNDPDPETAYVLGRLSDVIDTEKPDLLALTGDIVTGGDLALMWARLRAMLDEKGVPYFYVHGNHDREENLSDLDLPKCFVGDPLCVNTVDADGYLQDFVIPIASSSSGKTAAVLYCIDSGDYSPVATHWDYGWITHDQIHWYVEKSREFARANSNVPVPSYAFFHIPTNDYNEAWRDGRICGNRGEDECPGELNSGIMSAFEENGDVHAIFVGHDHENDYVARLGGIAAVYGRCCFKRDGRVPGNGTRVIELSEGDYGFRTWIREPEAVVDDIHFDVKTDFVLRKAENVHGLVPGLVRTMYSDVKVMTEMETAAVRGETTVVPTPRLRGKVAEGDYGMVQEGYLYVPETGCLSLHVSEYDEGLVVIDDAKFGPTDYGRGQIKLNLEKGYHPIKIYMKTCNGSGCWCKLMWRDQYNIAYHEVPAENFFHKK